MDESNIIDEDYLPIKHETNADVSQTEIDLENEVKEKMKNKIALMLGIPSQPAKVETPRRKTRSQKLKQEIKTLAKGLRVEDTDPESIHKVLVKLKDDKQNLTKFKHKVRTMVVDQNLDLDQIDFKLLEKSNSDLNDLCLEFKKMKNEHNKSLATLEFDVDYENKLKKIKNEKMKHNHQLHRAMMNEKIDNRSSVVMPIQKKKDVTKQNAVTKRLDEDNEYTYIINKNVSRARGLELKNNLKANNPRVRVLLMNEDKPNSNLAQNSLLNVNTMNTVKVEVEQLDPSTLGYILAVLKENLLATFSQTEQTLIYENYFLYLQHKVESAARNLMS
eukprot:CAMPEP_0116912398 /NCGR_PEP_ID=MMETSP0467-20121206/16061_1 /TAXON_ID=283647 /ORGANISM="Mesodinium pulex, Strain SPMC105" /LENGTH=331 /DNA_ID=CAMNT_0004588367 /DNA_START=569 /DNA_END=1564 /DNA_ORIENTATION=+